ncbi:UNVERIFIED_CONTAM: hypothetical protein RMT77_004841 [Armadillidium vulgare]
MSIDTFLFLQNERGYYENAENDVVNNNNEQEEEDDDESYDLFRVEKKNYSLSSATLKVLCAETSLDFEKMKDFFKKKEYSKMQQQSHSYYKTLLLRDPLEILSSKEKLLTFLRKGELIERDFRKLVDESYKTYKIFLSEEKAKEKYKELPSEFRKIDGGDNNNNISAYHLNLPSCKIIINTAPKRYCNNNNNNNHHHHHYPSSLSSSEEETTSFEKAYSLLKSCPRKGGGGGRSSNDKLLCDDLFFSEHHSRFFFSSEGAKILLQKTNEVLPPRRDVNTDDSENEFLYYQLLLQKIDVLKNYIPPYFIVDPDIIGEITNFPNRDTFPLIILLNAFEWCLSRIVENPFSLHNMDYVFAKIFTQNIKKANNDFCRAKTYVRHRIFTTVKLFCSAMAKFIRTDYKHENLARSIERDVDSFLLSIMRRKNDDEGDYNNNSNSNSNSNSNNPSDLFKFIDHKSVCKRNHRYAVYGRFYETIFSTKTNSNLLNLIKETEYKILLDQNALKNIRSRLKDSPNITTTTTEYYWWEPADRKNVREVLQRHLMNNRKITFENIEFFSPAPYYFLWGSFFLMASCDFSTPNTLALEQQQDDNDGGCGGGGCGGGGGNGGGGNGDENGRKNNNLVLSSKMLLSDFMIHHVYMMVGCSICEHNYSQKLKYAMEMSFLIIQHTTLLREKSGNIEIMGGSSRSSSSSSSSGSSTLHILASSLQYEDGGEKFIKTKNNNNLLQSAKDYISYFVEFIFGYEEREEKRDILQLNELKALIYFSSYLSLLLLIMGDPIAQRSIFTELERRSIFFEKARGFQYFNDFCHTISLWLLRNVIRLENKSNLFPLNRIIDKRNIENFKFAFFEIFFHKNFNLGHYHQYLIQNGFDDIRKLLIRKENEDRPAGNYNSNIEDDEDDDDDDDDDENDDEEEKKKKKKKKKKNKGQTKRPLPSTKKTFSNNSNFFSQYNTEEDLLKANVIPFFKGEINGNFFRK